MTNFVEAIAKEVNKDNKNGRTQNGMKAYKKTKDATLDFFSIAGSARGKNVNREFISSLNENEEMTLRALLWLRDVRGGAGERKQFRDLLALLEKTSPNKASQLMKLIPDVGRWDDLFVYSDPLNRENALKMYSDALLADNALAAKWAPRKGPNAIALRKFMKLSPKAYRKLVVSLTKVVETDMCAKRFNEIDFSKVPSLAAARYQNAFAKNAPIEYSKYIRDLEKDDGTAKINAGAVYPYDVIKSVAMGNQTVAVANAQWKALPNYVGDAKILPMVDVSGSMGALGSRSFGGKNSGPSPIEVAVSLGLYLSEKNTSAFKDLFLTFSNSPKFVKLRGDISDRLYMMKRSEWGMNTNIELAFKRILSLAMENNVSQKDMPEYLLILSDMQFDVCAKKDVRIMKMIKGMYKSAGYEMPKIVFWNILSSIDSKNTPVKFDSDGTALVSGFSPSIMKSILSNNLEDFSPYNVMKNTLMVDRYDYKNV